MTKEEIINKHTSSERRESDFNQSKGYDFKYLNLTSARLAMDEYAKKFGEKLVGWLNDNDFKFTSWKDNMQSDQVNNGVRMHVSEIVDLFIEQQNK